MDKENNAEKNSTQPSGSVISHKTRLQEKIDAQLPDNSGRIRAHKLVSLCVIIFGFLFFYGIHASNFISSALSTYLGAKIGSVPSDKILSHFAAGFLGKDADWDKSNRLTPKEIEQNAAAQTEREELFPAQKPAASSLGIVTMQGGSPAEPAGFGSGGLSLVASNLLNEDLEESQYGQPQSSYKQAAGQTEALDSAAGSYAKALSKINSPLFNSFLKELSDAVYKETGRDAMAMFSAPGGAEFFRKSPAANAVLMKYMKNPDFQKMMAELLKVQAAEFSAAARRNNAADSAADSPAAVKAPAKPVNNFTLMPIGNSSGNNSSGNSTASIPGTAAENIGGTQTGAAPSANSASGSPYYE